MAKVEIALATYNGERFLPGFLASLRAQDVSDWGLVARDDASVDGTLSTLEGFAGTGLPLSILRAAENGGALANFGALLRHTTARYVMPADQDDVWLPHRIRACLDGIRALERRHGTGVPALFFTDLEVVDEHLSTVSPSFWRHEGVSPADGLRLERLVVRNVSPGCAMIVNRALLDAALPMPNEAIMHDWWLMLVACALGVVGYDEEPTVRYRQHDANVLGARRRSLADRIRRFALERESLRAVVRETQEQARALLTRHDAQLRERDRRTLSAYCNAGRTSPVAHRIACLRAGIRPRGLVATAGLYALL